jgi:flagellar hook protein FlgE
MSLSALSSGLSALQSNQRALGVEAHNVANMSTQGFSPQQAEFQEASPAGSGVTLSVAGRASAAADDSAPSGTGLASSATNSLVYKAGFKLAAELIQASDERIGTLLDIKA